MGIKIYGSLQSTCTQRVVLVLSELGLSYELCEISMQKGEHKEQQYVKNYHPFGRIPVLEDESIRLFESRAICRYLVTKHGKNHVLDIGDKQSSPSEVGKWEQTASVEYSYFDPCLKALSYEKLFKKLMGHGDPDANQIKSQEVLLTQTLDYYDRMLSESPYLTGKEFGLVDLYHMPWLHMLPRLGLEAEISSRPAVKLWWGRISSRPSWKNLMQSLPKH